MRIKYRTLQSDTAISLLIIDQLIIFLGIFGMSLSPPAKDGYKLMYFSPLASHRQFVVSTSTLRNESKVENSWKEFYALDERGPNSHTTARIMDEFGVEFFNLIDQNAIGCWNSR